MIKYSHEVHRFFWTVTSDVYLYVGREEGFEDWDDIKNFIEYPRVSEVFNLPFWPSIFRRKWYKRLKKLTKLRAHLWALEKINRIKNGKKNYSLEH